MIRAAHECRYYLDTTDAKMRKLIKRGDLNKMSFAFTVKVNENEADKENKIYTLTITAFDKIMMWRWWIFRHDDGTSIQARKSGIFCRFGKGHAGKQRRKKLILMTYCTAS